MKFRCILKVISFCALTSIVFADTGGTPSLLNTTPIKLTPKMKVISLSKEDKLKKNFNDLQKHFIDIQILTDEEKIEETPRVVSDKDGKVMSVENDQVYINKLSNVNFYKPMAVYRIEPPIIDPITKKNLGAPFFYLSEAKLIDHKVANNLSLLQLSRVNKEVIIGDRVLNKFNDSKLTFDKVRKNKSNIKGYISRIVDGVKHAEVAQNIILDLGKKDKIKPGDLLQVKKQLTIKRSVQLHEKNHFTPDHFLNEKRDKNTSKNVELPYENIATILVYRVFENTSLAIVIDSKEPVQVKQEVVGFNK